MEEGNRKNDEREENSLKKSSQALGMCESILRLGVSFPFGLTPFL